MFFSPRITSVFTSRWKALGWSAGVLMTAYCSIPSNDEDGADSTAADSAVAGLPEAGTSTQPAGNISPWAIDTPREP